MRMIRYYFRRFKKNQRGASIVEFAIVVPILIALLIGIIEFGWLFTGWVIITGAAREGARVAVVGNESEISERVLNHTDLLPFQNVDVSDYDVGDPGEETYVTVTGDLPLLVGLIGDSNSIIPLPLLPNPFPITAKATMRQEFPENN